MTTSWGRIFQYLAEGVDTKEFLQNVWIVCPDAWWIQRFGPHKYLCKRIQVHPGIRPGLAIQLKTFQLTHSYSLGNLAGYLLAVILSWWEVINAHPPFPRQRLLHALLENATDNVMQSCI